MLSVTLESVMIARFAGTTNKAGLGMGVFFSFCFISCYGGGLDVVGYVYCSKFRPLPLEFHNNGCQVKYFQRTYVLKVWRGPLSAHFYLL